MRALRLLLPAAMACAVHAQAPAPEFVLQHELKRPEPFEHTPLRVNPPTFRWPAAAGTETWRIEIARSTAFEDATVLLVGEPFLRPLQPLAPGRWYWRVRPERPETGDWIRAERFHISADLPRWTMPEWGKMLGRVPASHPRNYVRREQLTAYRTKAQGPLKDLISRWVRKMEGSLHREFNLEEYLRRVPEPSQAGTLEVRTNLRWALVSAGRDLGEEVAELSWLWLATGQPRFRDAARRRAMAAAALDPKGLVSVANSDFANASIAAGLALAYDFLFDEWTTAERGMLRTALQERALPIFQDMKGASQSLMRAHNWQEIYRNGMVAALALYGQEPEASAWLELGLKSFIAFYPWWGGKDGGSQEGAKYYYGLEMISSLDTRDLFENAFGVDFAVGNPWYRANPFYLMYAFPPGGVMARLGDTNEGAAEQAMRPPGATEKLAAQRMAHLYGNQWASGYAQRIEAEAVEREFPQALRWLPFPAVPPASLASLPRARAFPDIGAVFTHSAYAAPGRNVRMVFHSSPYGGFGHAHADQNSFHIIAYNEDLLLDSGYHTPAGDPHREEWAVETKAHNTLLVDRTGQPYGNTTGHGRLRHFEQNGEWVYWIGSAETAYKQVRLKQFDRHVVWLPGDGVETFVIVDEIAAADNGSHRIDWLLHAPAQMELGRNRVIARGDRSEAEILFLEPARLQIEQDSSFGAPAQYWRRGERFPLKDQWHLRATAEGAGSQRFVAVIQVSQPGQTRQAARREKDEIVVGTWKVRLPGAGGLIRVERGAK